MNEMISVSSYARRAARAVLGLVLFAFGVQCTVQAGIGLAPWDVLAMGVATRLGVSFGTMTLMLSIVVLAVDIALGAPIGVGTVLDTLIVGNAINLADAMGVVPRASGLLPGVILLVFGLFVMAFSQYLYMSAALCCGPRDSLLVALGRKLPRVPIGLVNGMILVCVLAFGWALGGPVGVGTVISAFGMGLIMQLVFAMVRFEPRTIAHEGFAGTFHNIKHLSAERAHR